MTAVESCKETNISLIAHFKRVMMVMSSSSSSSVITKEILNKMCKIIAFGEAEVNNIYIYKIIMIL